MNEAELYKELDVLTKDRVRMEAPEIFRMLSKRQSEFVRPYMGLLKSMAETDENRVVRIHCLGAVRAAES